MNEHIRYQVDEKSSVRLTLGVGVQGTLIMLSSTVMVTTILVLGAGESESYLSWAVFAALVISGMCTALQAGRFGRLGAGHLLMMGAGSAFLAVCVLAVTEGGPSTLASLIVVSSLLHFVMAKWLPKMRRIVTPVVTGAALMLIAVTVFPVAVSRLTEVPEGVPPAAGVSAGAAAFSVFLVMTLRGAGMWPLWAIPVSIAAGCVVASFTGLYDFQPVLDAPWFDMPAIGAWPGLDLTPGREFWAVLPAFLIVNLVVAVKACSDGAAIQQASRRTPRATDFRVVQGTINVGGLGILLSGIAGTAPPLIYTSPSISLINLTGVATRRVGSVIGAMLVLVAVFPKTLALMLTVPGSVMGAILLIIMGVVFAEGMRAVTQDGLDHRKALMAGTSVAIGAGLHSHNLFAELLGRTWGLVLGNGLVSGVLAILIMTSFMEVASRRRKRLETELSPSALPRIDAFLREIASGAGWAGACVERLGAAGEETLSSMLQLCDDYEGDAPPRLIITVLGNARRADLEFMAIGGEENIEDQLAYLVEHSDTPAENELSFRLLRHYASSVRHRKYHGIDVVTVQVEALPDRPRK